MASNEVKPVSLHLLIYVNYYKWMYLVNYSMEYQTYLLLDKVRFSLSLNHEVRKAHRGVEVKPCTFIASVLDKSE
jgi:hypothetical protein